LMICF